MGVDGQPIFYPKTVAVIGASRDENKRGGSQYLRSLIRFGYKGKLYPVNPQGGRVFGLTIYSSVKEIPDEVDSAIITIPAQAVPAVMAECAQKGVKTATMFTSGFSELGTDEGKRLEQDVLKAACGKVRIVGPNCFGAYCPRGGMTLMPGADFPRESGSVAMLSQSGGWAADFVWMAGGTGIRFSKVLSYGNGCDINEADALEYLAQDPDTRIITAYLEGVKDGARFYRLVKETVKKKPVIIWKGGLTRSGGRAVASHTGSLAGETRTWEAFFQQTGAVRVDGFQELLDTTLAFLHLPLSIGDRLGIVGGGGGIGVACSDICEKEGIRINRLNDHTLKTLKSVLPPMGTGIANPVDLGGPGRPAELIEKCMNAVSQDDHVDVLILIQSVHHMLLGNIPFADSSDEAIQRLVDVPEKIKQKSKKPVVVIMPRFPFNTDAVEVDAKIRRFSRYYFNKGIPVYATMEQAAKALGKIVMFKASSQLKRHALS